MPGWAALLRAVNVGGRNPIAMAALKDVCERLGFDGVKTVLQSGNVVFRAAGKPAALANQLAAAIEERFHARPALFLRSAAELRAVLAANPFPDEAKSDPGHLVVVFFDGTPASGAAKTLAAWDRGPEQAKLVRGNLYIYYPDGMGRSKLTNAVVERALGTPATARNVNTVGKLAALSAALGR